MSSTTEDYLKQIQVESERTGQEVVSLGRLSELVGVTPGTVTTMMKGLAEAGLVDYTPRSGVVLTDAGSTQANRMLRRHRLIELFLVDQLGLDWSEVHAEAELLEHAVSDRIVDRIDEMMGHPTTDPHGDPIPTARGDIVQRDTTPLSEAATGKPLRILRITNDEPSFLVFLKDEGLTPGTTVYIEERQLAAEVVRVSVGQRGVTLGLAAAERIQVVDL